MAAVSLQNLRKSYDGKTDVLAGIDLDIADGEFVVLVGPSGCGKIHAAAHGVRAGEHHRR
jgi:ABC-type sugar transport system ATPase subunit